MIQLPLWYLQRATSSLVHNRLFFPFHNWLSSHFMLRDVTYTIVTASLKDSRIDHVKQRENEEFQVPSANVCLYYFYPLKWRSYCIAWSVLKFRIMFFQALGSYFRASCINVWKYPTWWHQYLWFILTIMSQHVSGIPCPSSGVCKLH
jgi:hypothetical protein